MNQSKMGDAACRDDNTTLVLFSGGRDSSLAACLLATGGRLVHLFTCNNGVCIGGDLSQYRYLELQTALREHLEGRTVVSSMGLFRRVALQDIEADFLRFGKNLILLGSQLATHTEGIIFCLDHNLKSMAAGSTKYQEHFPEQMSVARERLQAFCEEFGIEYLLPVGEFANEHDVKYRLLDYGISTKSLEAVSIFSDTFSQPTAEQVAEYIELKLPICRDYIARKRQANSRCIL
jgi:predicted subunit of tRNA(5-methylaminomethyl-2-thiouridylate) methyltransferase